MPQKILHILIADDDKEDLDLIEESLLSAKPDAELSLFRNGKAVIEYLNAAKADELPSLIILDYSMPELNGAEVVSIICNNPRYKAIPIVILSTSKSPAHIQECKNKGAVEYIIKPNTMGELDAIAVKMLTFCS